MTTKAENIYRSEDKISNYQDYYKKVKPSENCVFCSDEKPSLNPQNLNLRHLRIVENRFPYDFWDMKKVKKHLMIIPLKHIDCVSKLNFNEQKELNLVMAHFSDAGYDIFVRSPKSTIKSIEHLHFHLIKTEDAKLNVSIEYSD